MSYIELQENNCKHCHHCVRSCPTKSIAFASGDPVIVEQECILCGQCYVVCPHNAKSVASDYSLVKHWLSTNQRVHLSLAPSFVALLNTESEYKDHLLNLGFTSVQETSLGAVEVSGSYRELCQDNTMENIITTCCPVVVSLIETRFPQLVSQLAPVMSPMRTHAKMIKAEYPQDKVVFLGPCIAKIKEAHDTSEVDGVITFEDIIVLSQSTSSNHFFTSEFKNDLARIYPATGGIIATMVGGEHHYQTMHVDGIDQVIDCCHAIMDHQIENVFIEMSACVGSCLGGPLLQNSALTKWKARQILTHQIKQQHWIPTPSNQSYEFHYQPKAQIKAHFSDASIKEVLTSLGKYLDKDHLNCGACGYNTCKEKAIGVLEGKADPLLCLPYALEQAKSMSHLIIEHTPNGILVIDNQLKVIEANPAALRYLKLEKGHHFDIHVNQLFHDDYISTQIQQLDEVVYFIRDYPQFSRTFDHACIPIKKQNIIVIILMDLTDKISKEKQLKEYRSQIMTITQHVIDEQMQTVQEIASLLGETTAKSKIALVKLKKSLEDDLL